jgi:hypothetical protein
MQLEITWVFLRASGEMRYQWSEMRGLNPSSRANSSRNRLAFSCFHEKPIIIRHVHIFFFFFFCVCASYKWGKIKLTRSRVKFGRVQSYIWKDTCQSFCYWFFVINQNGIYLENNKITCLVFLMFFLYTLGSCIISRFLEYQLEATRGSKFIFCAKSIKNFLRFFVDAQ